MLERPLIAAAFTTLLILVHFSFIARSILRPHREPASRIAWVIVILVLPILGIIAYVLLGETNIGRYRVARVREVESQLESLAAVSGTDAGGPPQISDRYAPLFRIGNSVNGFQAVNGNHGRLMHDSNSAIDALVSDIERAKDHVHVEYYIWLCDNNGLRVAEALKRAAGRGVACRAIADALGSRILIKSSHWQALRDTGVQVANALPIGNPLLRPLRGRIDLRNHRKIVVIDNQITYCGSQNCADPEFRIKARYAPWVDAVIRFEGPIARQNQHLFAIDWMTQTREDLTHLLQQPLSPGEPGFAAQVIGTGPTVRNSAMPEMFESLMYAARHELVITTPYYVPDESMQSALCASARRGVLTTLILPARCDSRVVAAASQSYYANLLAAGVRIFEFRGGMLHTKALTLDGEITLIGSANLDRRSFELNYENNILFHDRALTGDVRRRQEEYLTNSQLVTAETVAAWPVTRQLWNNTIAMLGPVL